ncbi:hypothetical protein DAI22_02g370532 [Oryza sativa Japonica Group]|nr:hypothetical protein DAI22_02g370532 [Oryza sativa Japonica Group]
MTEVAAAAAAGGSARGTGGTGDRANDEEKFIFGHLSKANINLHSQSLPGHIKECVNHVENQCGWAPAPGCLKEALATCAK